MPGALAAQGYAVASRDTASAVFLDGRRRVRVLAISAPFGCAVRSTPAGATSGWGPLEWAATGSTSGAELAASGWAAVTPACESFGCAAGISRLVALAASGAAAASGSEPFIAAAGLRRVRLGFAGASAAGLSLVGAWTGVDVSGAG